MTEKKARGRPEFSPTDDDREKVRVLKATGMTNTALAVVIGVTEPTLRKHFAAELDIGSAKVRADVTMARYRAAMGGNVQAQARILDQINAVGAAEALEQRANPTLPPKLGKKEQRQQAAERVIGKYAPPPGPRLVVANG